MQVVPLPSEAAFGDHFEAALQRPWPQRWHDSLESTNTTAREALDGDEHGPFWVAARTQTAGRGRRGRQWISKPGNLYTTAGFIVETDPSDIAKLCFVLGLAVADAIFAESQGTLRPRLKWPNDVRVERAKLCGILIETGRLAPGRYWVVCGVGINLQHKPESLDQAATSLSTLLQRSISPEDMLNALDLCFRKRLNQFLTTGFDSTRTDWLKDAEGLGEEFQAQTSDGPRTGRFEDVTQDGSLVLRSAQDERFLVTAGDVQLVNEV